MTPEKFVIERCVEFKILEGRRYREACHIYSILNSLLKKTGEGSLVLIEREGIREADNKKEELDTVIKLNDDNNFLIELKTSVRDEEEVKKTFEQLENRDDNFIYQDEKIKINNLVLLCHEDDFKMISKVYNELIKNNELKLDRPLTILTWGVGVDKGCMESYYINYALGEFENNLLLKKIKGDGIKKSIVRTFIDAERNKFFFTNVKPFPQYLFVKFKSFINQRISNIVKNPTLIKETINIGATSEVIEDFKKIYSNDLITPRSDWVKNCIDFFDKIDWLSKKEDGIIEISLNKFRLKNINENDELRYFAKILCKQEKIKQEKLKKKKLSKVKRLEKQAENKLKKLGESQKTLF